MSQILQMRGARENDPRFGKRMSGEGIFAELQARRFRLACERFGLDTQERRQLDAGYFRAPATVRQLSLF